MCHHGADLFSKDSWWSSWDRPYNRPPSTPLFSYQCCDLLFSLFTSLEPLTSPNLSLSSLGLQACLLLHKEHWVHYTERSCPPTNKRSSPPTSLLFPDLFPSHQSGLPCLHASWCSFYFLRKPKWKLTPFLPCHLPTVLSQMVLKNNHEFFLLKINPFPPPIYQSPSFKLNLWKGNAPCFLLSVLTHTFLTRQIWQPITLLKQL